MKGHTEAHGRNGPFTMELNGLAETRRLGCEIARLLRSGDIILLSGDLGTGKTTLAKAIGEGLGIDPAEITSPTFAIIHEYPEARLPLVHADMYRLGENADIEETGLEEYLTGGHAVLVEWAEFLPGDTCPKALEIFITHPDLPHDSGRRVHFSSRGSAWKGRLPRLLDRMTAKQ